MHPNGIASASVGKTQYLYFYSSNTGLFKNM